MHFSEVFPSILIASVDLSPDLDMNTILFSQVIVSDMPF